MTMEDEAWAGQKRTKRQASLPPRPSKTVELTGYLPDFQKLGLGLGYLVVGILCALLLTISIVPEWKNLDKADTCANDCSISKGTMLILAGASFIGAILGVFGGLATIFASSGAFCENTLTMKMRELGGVRNGN